MRFAGGPEIYEAVKRSAQQGGMPPAAASHRAAETLAHGEDPVDGQVGAYQEFLANYISKGFNKEAAAHLALEALEGGEPPSQSVRFQGLSGMPIGYDMGVDG